MRDVAMLEIQIRDAFENGGEPRRERERERERERCRVFFYIVTTIIIIILVVVRRSSSSSSSSSSSMAEASMSPLSLTSKPMLVKDGSRRRHSSMRVIHFLSLRECFSNTP